MNLVTVATNFNLAEAGLVCARLEAAGFHPFMGNENASSWLGGTMSTATLLRIEVPENEAEAAKEFLDAPAE
jgi:Putative prokaryotic signal transducing protein